MYTMAVLFKQHSSLGKKFPATVEPGIPLYPSNSIKNRKVRNLLDTRDPKDEMLTIQIPNLRLLRARAHL